MQTLVQPEPPRAVIGDTLDPYVAADVEIDTWAEVWQASDVEAQEDIVPLVRAITSSGLLGTNLGLPVEASKCRRASESIHGILKFGFN